MKPWLMILGMFACAPEGTDADGDGWTVEDGDCDDQDSRVYPGAEEQSETDAWDQDCDGPGE